VTGNELTGWRVDEFGRSRDGVPMRVFLPEGHGPIAGLLTAAQHGEEADTLMRHADTAMYVAKRTKHGFAVYAPQEDEKLTTSVQATLLLPS